MAQGAVVRLFDEVVDPGWCIGCGLCAALPGSPLEMSLTSEGTYAPVLRPGRGTAQDDPDVMAVCPFSDDGQDEDELSVRLFPDVQRRDDIGGLVATYAGHVAEGDFRATGSSGGMARWVLSELLRTGHVDHVVHVKPATPGEENPTLFRFAVDTEAEQLRSASRAAYHPVEMSEVVEVILAVPGRYAITGVPCFVKGLRRLAQQEPAVAQRVVVTVGIICGHLKTTAYAESLAWQMGVAPADLGGIDFRTKIPGRTAREKGVTAFDRAGAAHGPAVVQELAGTAYQNGFFKCRACNVCDDVTAETADISVGDAWLPGYDGAGNSLVVLRDRSLLPLIEAARADGRLALDEIDPASAAASQAGGLRDRREGLAYRLHLLDRAGKRRPRKRVQPSADMPVGRRVLYRLRVTIAARSVVEFDKAKASDDLDLYLRRMSRWTKTYRLAEIATKKVARLRRR